MKNNIFDFNLYSIDSKRLPYLRSFCTVVLQNNLERSPYEVNNNFAANSSLFWPRHMIKIFSENFVRYSKNNEAPNL